MWKKSSGNADRAAIGGCVGFAQRDVVDARPLESDETGLDVDFLEDRVGHRAVGGPADRGEVAEDRVVRGDQRGPAGCELEFVQVRLQPVAGLHLGYVCVAAVVDHVVAEPEAMHRDVALPPRQHRFARVFLDLQVGRRGVASGAA